MDIWWASAATTLLLLINTTTSNANEIYINQAGNNLDLEVNQRSKDNYVSLNSTGSSNNITVRQGMHEDGTIDIDEEGGHEAYWTITGDGNTVGSAQTDTNRSSGGAPHHLANIVNGDNNVVYHTQMGRQGHDGFVEIQGDNNEVNLYQRGNGGQKWADVVLTGDGHSVDIMQRGTEYAEAEVDLTNSGGAYNFELTQNVSTTSGFYSVTGFCTNTAGCSLSIDGNN
jgi:hypothetical protein